MNEIANVAPAGLANKVANAQLSFGDWQLLKDQAKILMDSQFLPASIKTPQQAMIVGLAGRELGLPLMTAMRAINVINNRPSPSAQLKLALALRTKQVEDLKIQRSPTGCTVEVKRKGWSTPIVASFTESDAKAMGLSTRDQYNKQPQTMYQWRAIDKALNVAFADVVLGLDDGKEIEELNIPSEETTVDVQATVDSGIQITGEAPRTTTLTDSAPSREDKNLTKSIIGMLAQMNGDNLEAMEANLKDITMYNGRWVTIDGLDEIAKSNPKRLFMINKSVTATFEKFVSQNH